MAHMGGPSGGSDAENRPAGRPTEDVLIIMVAVTLCVCTLVLALSLAWLAVAHPGEDHTGAGGAFGELLAALMALLAGFIVGRITLGRKS